MASPRSAWPPPGVNILSTLPGGKYGDMSGTSMATPMVTGVLALVWSEHPGWTYTQVINQVLSTVTKEPSLSGKVASGGVLNAAAAVANVQTASTPPGVVSATASGPAANTLSTIQVTFDRAISLSSFNTSNVTLLTSFGKTIAITKVTVVANTSDRTFNITFATQNTPGNYTVYIGSNATDLAGNHVTRYSNTFKIAAPVTPAATPPPTSGPQVISSSASGPTANTLSTIQVTFNRPISLSSFNSSNVTLLTSFGKTIAITKVAVVANTNDCTFNITFAAQSTVGTYTMYLGSNATDLAGNHAARYVGTYKITAASTSTPPANTFTSSTAVAIPPGGTGVSLLTIGPSATIGSLTVTVDIQYPKVSDLYIHLQSPDGTNLILFDQMGGTNANLLGTTFSDQASTYIGFAPGAMSGGTFQPMTPLKGFAGKNMSGTWKLWPRTSAAAAARCSTGN